MKTLQSGKMKLIAGILVIIIIVLLCIIFIPRGRVEAPTSETATTTTPIDTGVIVATTTESYNQPSYTADAEVPTVIGLADTSIQKKINDALSAKIKSIITDFESQAVNTKVTDGPGTKSSLDIKVESWSVAKKAVLSVRLGVLTYFSGSAHPITVSETSNFDLLTGDKKAGEDLEAIDIFDTSNVAYLQVISDYSTKALKTQIAAAQNVPIDSADLQFFAEGSNSNPENFSTFSVESDGIRFIFGQYQVAPYVFGEQEVLIPYSILSNYMQKNALTTALLK